MNRKREAIFMGIGILAGLALSGPAAQPYQEESAPTASTLSEETVRAAILALKEVYPHGAVYGSFYRSHSSGPYGMAPSHCAGWGGQYFRWWLEEQPHYISHIRYPQ